MNEFNMDKYDKMIDRMTKTDYEIPEEFDKRVENTLLRLKKQKHFYKYPAAAAAFILAIFLLVNLFPSVAIQASEIPGLNVVIDWLVINKGEEKALKHGYPNLGPVTVRKNNYTLLLDDIFIDDISIRLSARLTSDELLENILPELIEERSNLNDEKADPISFRQDSDSINFYLQSNDFELQSFSISQFGNTQGVIAKKIEMRFPGEEVLSGFLDTNPEYLSFTAKITRGGDNECIIEDIRIPIDKSKILHSRHYNLSETMEFDYGKVSLEHLKVSPTRMAIETHFIPEGDLYIERFEKMYLKDSMGNIYEPSGGTGMDETGDNWNYYFVPSIYFNDMPEKLYFCFDGIRVGSRKDSSFILNMNEAYPKTHKFMGESFIIETLKWHENNVLEIRVNMPKHEIMSLGNIYVDGERQSGSKHIIENQENDRRDAIFYIDGITKKDSYRIILNRAGYYINIKGQVELDIK